jgi:hypothetical protein
MKEFKTYPLPLSTFRNLANLDTNHCVSIYMPMFKSGKEQNKGMGPAILKECVREAAHYLSAYQLEKEKIEEYLKPIMELEDNSSLWRNPSEGLVLFLDPDNGLRYYTLPLAFKRKVYVDNHFYVSPLLPLYHNDGIYYLLVLSQDYVKLYKASKNNFRDTFIEDLAPKQLEEAVGFDYKEKMLQFRSGHAAHGAGSFHGHGEGKDDEKKELTTFFRQIDKAVIEFIKDKEAPLVLAGVDRLHPLYKKINTYPNLFNSHLSGDKEFEDKTALHRDSWELIKGYFSETMRTKLEQFKEVLDTPKSSYELHEIVPAAFDGKIDTLFVEEDNDVYGQYDLETRDLKTALNKAVFNASLVNMVAIKTFMKGGRVYFLDKTEMPVKDRVMNALMRF